MIFLHRHNVINANIIPDGIEIDIRTNHQGLVLTHDVCSNGNEYNTLENEIKKFPKGKTIIANMKESGNEEAVLQIMKKYNIDCFFLDSQIPDILRLCKEEKYVGRFIIRVSDMETLNENLMDIAKPKYVWTDWSKYGDFYLDDYVCFINTLTRQLTNGQELIIVSPELYSSNYKNLIYDVATVNRKLNNNSACTKLPKLWEALIA